MTIKEALELKNDVLNNMDKLEDFYCKTSTEYDISFIVDTYNYLLQYTELISKVVNNTTIDGW